MKHGIVLSIGLILAAATAACSTKEPAPGSAPHPVAVTTAEAVETDLARPFEVGGVVRARTVAAITARITAEVRSVAVRPGDRVRAGQTLVTLDARELIARRNAADASHAAAQQGIALAEADRAAAGAALALARATHQRFADLRARNAATPHELDEAVAGLRAAEARLNVADARLSEARAMIDAAAAAGVVAAVTTSYAVLTAPFDGLVTEKLIEPGNMAGAGMPLVTVEDTAGFRLEVRLDESRAALVAPGQNVDVLVARASDEPTPGADPGTRIPGRVTDVARVMETGSHDFLVKVDLPGASGLRSGMFGRAVFKGAPRPAIAVPDAAVVRRGQLAFVFVADSDGVARLRLVNVSRAVDGLWEVRAGLVAGERVVTSPPATLVDGARVTDAGVRPAEAR